MIQQNVVLFLFVTLTIILVATLFIHYRSRTNECFVDERQKRKHNMWVYWELVNGATSPPEYIKLCMDIMKKNGDRYFNVIFLNEKTIFNYLPDLRKDINDLPIALKTDYIRVRLLYQYGGLWIDADTIVMSNLKEIADNLDKGTDYIGFGCTGAVCKGVEGYGRPSNGVMGSIKGGRLISRCLNSLNKKLDGYYAIPKDKRKEFDYFDLGKIIIWEEYDKLMKEDPTYKLYHVPSYQDGTRDADGKWIARMLIFKQDFKYSRGDDLMVVMLVNSSYCGKDPKFNWFCKLSQKEILEGDYFVSELFRKAIKYDPYNN